MRIHWSRVIALTLTLTGLIILLRYRHAIMGFLTNVERIGPGNSPEDQVMGLLAIGMIGVCVVSVVKILTHRPDR